MSDKVTAPRFRALRDKGERIVCLTAYDATLGSLADAAGVDAVLVGDSVGNVVLGYDTTIPVNLDDMVHHTAATRRGVERALLVADLPFGSYQTSVESAVAASVQLAKAGAEAVKLEGEYLDEIQAIVKAGIPVMGHLGMTPQSVHQFGGPRVQGKGSAGDEIIASARRVQEAGAFAIVLELIPADLATRITEDLDIPTIGIGAGVGCSGQIQVIHDVLGLSGGTFRHARAFMDGRMILVKAISDYASAVRNASFPSSENSF